MPMHDWTKVEAGIYHDFHTLWIVEIRNALNRGLLPPEYYALVEQNITGALGVGPDILTLRPPPKPKRDNPFANRDDDEGGVATALAPTAVASKPRPQPTAKYVAVRHVSTHDVVALVELLSPGNESNARDYFQLVAKLGGALRHGLHLVVLDPFPPTSRDRNGIHAAIWKDVGGKPPYVLPAGKPLTLAAYANNEDKLRAYVQPVAVGDVLPSLPLFYTPHRHVTLPLEATYTAAWDSVPATWQQALLA